jgi:hypothetical protein
MSKIIKRKPSKICPCCGKRFFKGNRYTSNYYNWSKLIYCSKRCGAYKVPIKEYKQQKLQKILLRTITTKSGCMEYQGNIDQYGYGKISVFNKTKHTHRHVWELLNGELDNIIHVLHKCDNRKCVNPDHLFLGTNLDNMRDCINKGRRNCSSKLNPNKIKQICQMAKEGLLYKDIAMQFNITCSYSSRIARKNGIKRINKYANYNS